MALWGWEERVEGKEGRAGDRKKAGGCRGQTLLLTDICCAGSFLLALTYQTPLFWKLP